MKSPPLDRRIVELARRQHGILALRQLVGIEYSTDAIYRRVKLGTLHRMHRGVYSIIPPELLKPDAFRMAAVLASGRGAVLSHRTAGVHLGLISADGRRFDISIASDSGRKRPKIAIHRARTLRAQDVTTVRGIPTTTPVRTLFDLATGLTHRQLERAIDEAVVQDEAAGGHGYPTIQSELQEQIRHNRGRERTMLQAILAERRGAAPTWNEVEELMLQLIHSASLPAPAVQVPLDLHDGGPMIQPDFMYSDLKLIIETDGFREHGKRTSFEDDRLRDQRAATAGYETVRVTWRQLTREPLPLTRRLKNIYKARAELRRALAA